MESVADKYNQNNSVGTADVKMSNNERPGKTNSVLERTWHSVTDLWKKYGNYAGEQIKQLNPLV